VLLPSVEAARPSVDEPVPRRSSAPIEGKWSFGTTRVQNLILSVTLAVLLIYTGYTMKMALSTQDQAQSTQEQLKLQREQFDIDMRPYVSINPEQKFGTPTEENPNSSTILSVIVFRHRVFNAGRVPVRFWLTKAVFNGQEAPLGEECILFPGRETDLNFPIQLPTPISYAALTGTGEIRIDYRHLNAKRQEGPIYHYGRAFLVPAGGIKYLAFSKEEGN
jgi:hypothetical protein